MGFSIRAFSPFSMHPNIYILYRKSSLFLNVFTEYLLCNSTLTKSILNYYGTGLKVDSSKQHYQVIFFQTFTSLAKEFLSELYTVMNRVIDVEGITPKSI